MMGSGDLQSDDRKNEQAEKKQSPKSNRLVKYKNTKQHRTHGTDARPYRVSKLSKVSIGIRIFVTSKKTKI